MKMSTVELKPILGMAAVLCCYNGATFMQSFEMLHYGFYQSG